MLHLLIFQNNYQGGFMKFGVRNQFVGKITEIKKGNVMCQINLDVLKADKMSSVITVDSLVSMKLKVGDEIQLIVKAINVIPAKK